ncbi:hypothetical protein AB4Y89_22110 [Terriglobus sp. 2YAB30_2]
MESLVYLVWLAALALLYPLRRGWPWSNPEDAPGGSSIYDS